MSLFAELKRRNVIRLAGLYLVAAWLIVQVAGTLFPLFGFDETPARITVIVLAIGFVPALVFAWIFELTAEGLRRESEIDRSALPPRSGRTIDRLIMAVLALALGYFALDKFVLDPARDRAREQEVAAQARSSALGASYGERSIAVLPFANLSADPEQEYLGDGIAEELLNLLARVPRLRVISRSSAFSFKGKDADVATIAKQLNVAHVLEGSVRRAGERIRISVQLIEARSDTQLWSATFERPLGDVFAIQDEVAAKVAEQLRIALQEPPHSTVLDPAAYAMLLQARQILNMERSAEFGRAEQLLQQVLQIDPRNVDALVEMVSIHESRRRGGDDVALRHKHETLDRILEIDPQNASARAWLAFGSHDIAEAARLLEEAAAVDPSNPHMLLVAIGVASDLGRFDQAVRVAQYLAERDPLLFWAQLNLAEALLDAGRVPEALDRYRIALNLNPDAGAVRWKYGQALLHAGDAQAALVQFEQDPDHSYSLHGRVLALHTLGRESEARAALQELTALEQDIWPFGLARAHAWLGDIDEAFAWLDKTRLVDPLTLSVAGRNPLLRPLHGDPRWLSLLRAMERAPEQVEKIRFTVEPPE